MRMPIVPDAEAIVRGKTLDPRTFSAEEYIVYGDDAIEALRNVRKDKAASYWMRLDAPRYLRFPLDCCKVVSS